MAIGIDQSSFGSWLDIRQLDGPAFRVEPFRPRLFYKRDASDELASYPIDYVIKRVAVGLRQKLSRLSVDRLVEQHGDLNRIPIMRVVRRVLEIPFHFSSVGIDGQQRIRVEVVAFPVVAIVIGRGISGGPIQRV